MDMLFNKNYNYGNVGFVCIKAKAGEIHPVDSEDLQAKLIKNKIAVPASEVIEEELDNESDEHDDIDQDIESSYESESEDTSEGEESQSEVEPDDLTKLYKIGKAGEKQLNEQGIFTYNAVAELLESEEGRQILIDLAGFTEAHIPRLEDSLVVLLEMKE